MVRLMGKLGFVVLLCVLTLAAQSSPNKTVTRNHRKSAKAAETAQAPPPPATIPEMWPEQLPPQPPRVSYQNGILTVDSKNSTLRDILNAIRRQTGAQMDVPTGIGTERVAGHFSGSAHDVLQGLLDGSNLGYVILSSPTDPARIDKVILSTSGNLAGAMSSAPSAPNGAPSFGRRSPGAPAPSPDQGDDSDFAGSMPPDDNAPSPDQAAPPPSDPAATAPGPQGGPPVSNVPKTGPPAPDQPPTDQGQVRSPEDYLRQLQEKRQVMQQQQQMMQQQQQQQQSRQ